MRILKVERLTASKSYSGSKTIGFWGTKRNKRIQRTIKIEMTTSNQLDPHIKTSAQLVSLQLRPISITEILSPNHWILPLKIIYLKILVFLENIPHPLKQSVKLSANISTDKAMKGNRSISDWFLFNFATISKIKHLQDLVVKSKVDNS